MSAQHDYTKKVPLSRLRPGMFVEDVFDAQGRLLLRADERIGAERIEELARRGVESVYINVQKGDDLEAEPHDGETVAMPRREVEYYKEIEQAREIRTQTLSTARTMLEAIRKGRSFDLKDIETSAEGMIESILRNADALVSLCQIRQKDDYTFTHSVNVGVLAASLAHTMAYEHDRLLEIGLGGLLHDIGKMRVPDAILNKPGKYVDWEFDIMKKHPGYGLDIVRERNLSLSETTLAVIGQHHERFNGKGYPRGLYGDRIHEAGLISAVADVYDALTSDRIYRTAWTPQKSLALIFQGCDSDYSRRIVELFTRLLGVYPVGSFVRLVSGEMGVVVRVEPGRLLAPTVIVLFDRQGRRRETPMEYDLFELQNQEHGKEYKIAVSLNPRAYRVNVEEFIGTGKM